MDILYHFRLTPEQQGQLTYRQFLQIVDAVKQIRADVAK